MKDEQLSKARFFGRCLGQVICLPEFGDSTYTLIGIGKSSYSGQYMVDVAENNDQFLLSDCRIIGRRIKDMTNEEKTVVYKIFDKSYEYGYFEGARDLIDYYFDIGVFPDKYFDGVACEMCLGSGFYGDNCAGIKGNNEYTECDICGGCGKIDIWCVEEKK